MCSNVILFKLETIEQSKIKIIRIKIKSINNISANKFVYVEYVG